MSLKHREATHNNKIDCHEVMPTSRDDEKAPYAIVKPFPLSLRGKAKAIHC